MLSKKVKSFGIMEVDGTAKNNYCLISEKFREMHDEIIVVSRQ